MENNATDQTNKKSLEDHNAEIEKLNADYQKASEELNRIGEERNKCIDARNADYPSSEDRGETEAPVAPDEGTSNSQASTAGAEAAGTDVTSGLN